MLICPPADDHDFFFSLIPIISSCFLLRHRLIIVACLPFFLANNKVASVYVKLLTLCPPTLILGYPSCFCINFTVERAMRSDTRLYFFNELISSLAVIAPICSQNIFLITYGFYPYIINFVNRVPYSIKHLHLKSFFNYALTDIDGICCTLSHHRAVLYCCYFWFDSVSDLNHNGYSKYFKILQLFKEAF